MISITKMKKSDINQVLNLEDSHKIHILNANILNSDLDNDNYYYLVAKIDEKIVGYIGISYIIDSADVISIVVDKNYTRQGIATMLLNSIFDFAVKNNITKIMLEVRKSNISAQKLYEKNGFKKISVRKNYYDNIEDAFIYLKALKKQP